MISCFFIGQSGFLLAAEKEQLFLMDDSCQQVLIGPVVDLEKLEKEKIESLKGNNFCLKIVSGDEANGKSHFVNLSKSWLLDNQIVEMGGGNLLTEVNKNRQNVVFSSDDVMGQPLVMQVQPREQKSGSLARDFFQDNPVTTASSVTIATVFSFATIANFLFGIQGTEQLRGLFVNLLGVTFLWRKRRRVAGVVYDGITGGPISLATVSVVDENGKIKETKVTDRNGAYFFLVTPGKYQLRVAKEGYRIIKEEEDSKLAVKYRPGYFEGKTLQLSGDDLIIKEAIALIKSGQTVSLGGRVALFFEKLSGSLFWEILFWVGFIFSSIILFFNPTAWNFLINAIYLISYLFQKANFHKISWGTVFSRGGSPEAFAMIRVFSDDNEDNFIARVIADEKGRYALILDAGNYILKANDSQGKQGEKGRLLVRLNKRKFVTENIVLSE